jgi:uncharacterized protein (DUF885 family)
MRTGLIFLAATLALVSCSQHELKNSVNETSKDMNKIFDNYYEERLRLFPLEATAIADNRYNDQLPCDISDAYREKVKSFYKKYLGEISAVKRQDLKSEEALSYDVFKREMEIQLEGLHFHDNLNPH